MSDSSENLGGAEIIELTGKIMVVAIVLLLFIVVFVFCLHIYAKYFWYRRRENPVSASRRSRLDFAGAHQEIAALRRGLEPSLLKTLPVVIFDPKDFKDGLECSVCLSEVSHGEKTRLLPKCNHGFHLECIDMWFESHSTCPLCRNPIKNHSQSGEEAPPSEAVVQAPAVDVLAETPNFPTNVLIWGDETQVSTSAICVEENNTNNNNTIGTPEVVEPSSSSSMGSTSGTPDGISHPQNGSSTTIDIHDDNEHKFPLATRLRAFKGLLGYNNRRVNPSSSGSLDLEQGVRGQS